MCLSDTALDWPPPCPKCGKPLMVIGGVSDFSGDSPGVTMSYWCPDWPQRCDMREPER